MAPRKSGSLVALVMLGAACTGYTFLTPSAQGRRAAMLGAAGAAATAFQTAEAKDFGENPSSWLGYYKDPQHPQCPRLIKYDYNPGAKSPLIVEAGDGEPGCEKRVSKYWRGRVTFTPGSDSVSIDFTDKGGPAEVVGKWDGSGIVFPDGNKWTKLISVGVGEGQPIMTAR